MCTAIFKNSFLARTVDRIGSIDEHFIISKNGFIGGVIRNGYGEIWLDGMNRHGLMAALLNYKKEMTRESSYDSRKATVHPSRLVPLILESCKDTDEAKSALLSLRLTHNEPEMYPHYIFAHKSGSCFVYENGEVYQNSLGVLTNAPSFPKQVSLSKLQSKADTDFYSSTARFSRMALLKDQVSIQSTYDCFDLLTSVAVPQGADKRHGYRTVLRCVLSGSDMTYSYAVGCSGSIKTVSAEDEFELCASSDSV